MLTVRASAPTVVDVTTLSRDGDVFVLDISDRPDDDHRFTYERMAALDGALTEVEASNGPAGLVVTAQGKFFSNGLVPELFVEPEYSAAYQHLVARFLVSPVPSVCAINGHCYAGGLLLALACDERYARSERGFLCLPETSIKVPFTSGLAALAMARLAPHVAHTAMVLSQRYDAVTAAKAGIVDGAIPEADLLRVAIARAGELAPLRGSVLAANKSMRYASVVDALHNNRRSTSRWSPDMTSTSQRLEGRTMLMSGGSRGIGLAIAIAAAREGANVAILAKTDVPDPRLPGTIHTAVTEIEAAGGAALGIVGDVRDEESVENAVAKTVERFGGVDIVVNNASAINLAKTTELPMKRFDLMTSIEHRGTYLLVSKALPHLVDGTNPHILTLSPPLNMNPKWLGAHPGYTLAKYGMSLLALCWAEEFHEVGVASNCLWPETMIATAAVQNLLGGDEAIKKSRTPEIMADAAIEVLVQPSRQVTGKTLIDADVLRGAGITDLTPYGGTGELEYDLFVDPPDRVL